MRPGEKVSMGKDHPPMMAGWPQRFNAFHRSGISNGRMPMMDQKMTKTMHEYAHGELHAGSKSGPKVTSRKQAVAIGMSEGRKAMKGR